MAVAVLVAALLPFNAVTAATEKPLFDQVGTLERFPADARALLGTQYVPTLDKATATQANQGGTTLLIPSARQLWQFYIDGFGTTVAVAVRDLDSFRIIKTLRLTFNPDRSSIGANGGEWAHAIDTKGQRLFLLSYPDYNTLYEFDLRTFAITQRRLPASESPSWNIVPGGMTYDPFHNEVVILYGGPPAFFVANVNTVVYRLDVSGAPLARADMTRHYYLRSCNAPVSTTDSGVDTLGWQVLASKDYLYVPCQRAGHTVAVVRIPRVTVADRPVEDVVAGPVYGDAVMADHQSGRMFITTSKREIWTFEASTMSFVGIVPTNRDQISPISQVGYGMDPETGRVYFQSDSYGLGVIEGRFFPLPQARTMPRFVAGHERIVVDTPTDRVFVLEGSDTPTPRGSKAASYTIYRTEPAPTPPSPPDPDRNTADVAEQEGVTETRYFANGSGYGARVLLAKGFSTIAPAPTVGVQAPTAQAIEENLNPKCGYTDRELVSARVRKAEYDTGSTAAAAIGFDVDDASKQDLDQPARCDVPIRANGTEQFKGLFSTAPELDRLTTRDDPATEEQESRWAPKQAECASSEGNAPPADDAVARGDLGRLDTGPATVECPEPGGTLKALATGRLSGGIEVAKAWTETKVRRLSGGGVESTVTAVAQGVTIAGVISFAEIRSDARSKSNGRPQKDAMSSHTVRIKGAVLNGVPICDDCADLRTLVNTLNAAVGGKALFRTGKADVGEGDRNGRDERLLVGTPKGALTAVQKSAARQASDRSLVGDFTAEIPGFEMTVFNDNTQWGRARQVYQFAGVATAATYNIVARPSGGSFEDGDPGDFSVADGGNTPFSGFAEALNGGGSSINGSPASAGSDDGNGGLFAPLRALARGIRLFFSNPRHALLLLTAWALFSLPPVLARRRRLLAAARLG